MEHGAFRSRRLFIAASIISMLGFDARARAEICLRGDVAEEIPSSAHAFLLVDCDGDGILDMACLVAGTLDLVILHGRGDGTFGDEKRARITRENRFLVAVDLDNDGDLEIAAAGDSNGSMIKSP